MTFKTINILRLLLPAILLCISGNIFSKQVTDKGLETLNLIFSYKDKYIKAKDTTETQVYLKHTFKTIGKRNVTLMLVPSMYSIAKGHRNYIGETIGTARILGHRIIDMTPQLTLTTIRKNRKVMPVIIDYATPNIYGEQLFGDNVLSPFYKNNARYYRYKAMVMSDSLVRITFKPKINNTQLVTGWAIVENSNGKIKQCHLRGTFDMIDYNVKVVMDNTHRLLPSTCSTKARFKFLGNRIEAELTAGYGAETSPKSSPSFDKAQDVPFDKAQDVPFGNAQDVPFDKAQDVPFGKAQDVPFDKLRMKKGRDLNSKMTMDSLRPMPLEDFERDIYNSYNQEIKDKERDSADVKNEKFGEKALNAIDDNLLSTLRFASAHSYLKLSPLINPLELSYSNSRGLAYRIKLDAKHYFSDNQSISINPRFGYNFKIDKFFYKLPLRYYINEKKESWIELLLENGNRITNSSVLDMIKDSSRDTIDFSGLGLDYFDDKQMKLHGNFYISPKLSVELGCTYHKRTAVNSHNFDSIGQTNSYNSFASLVSVSYLPSPTMPVFTASYERSIKGVLNSNIEYEKWEMDASYKKHISGMKILNIRLGGGFYTNKSTDYFVDFSNFRENYLPEGWDDEWTGNFQLLRSQWYNASEYYLRLNASYESPLMIMSRLPLIGKYVETERFYIGALRIQDTKPYSELGYSFTNRYFSAGVFTSFLGAKYHDIGFKFTMELFRRW